MRCHHFVSLTLLALAACAAPVPEPIARSFPAEGVTTVIVRAAGVDGATITSNAAPGAVEISGLPAGGARGYHPPKRGWRETPAGRWGLDFVARRYGNVLVISSKNEIRYIHHHYALEELRLRVPPGVEVLRQPRQLSESGDPDLSPPASRGERPR